MAKAIGFLIRKVRPLPVDQVAAHKALQAGIDRAVRAAGRASSATAPPVEHLAFDRRHLKDGAFAGGEAFEARRRAAHRSWTATAFRKDPTAAQPSDRPRS